MRTVLKIKELEKEMGMTLVKKINFLNKIYCIYVYIYSVSISDTIRHLEFTHHFVDRPHRPRPTRLHQDKI
jgi:hypothetical protein